MQTHERYYMSVKGDWAGTVTLENTDWRLFLAAPLSLLNRLQFVIAFLGQKLLNSFDAETRVELSFQDRCVYHITRILKGRICFYDGKDRILLDENGTDLLIDGYGCIWPLLGRKAVSFQGCRGRVHESAAAATYFISFFGVECTVETRIVDNGADIVYDMGWAKGIMKLHGTKTRIIEERPS